MINWDKWDNTIESLSYSYKTALLKEIKNSIIQHAFKCSYEITDINLWFISENGFRIELFRTGIGLMFRPVFAKGTSYITEEVSEMLYSEPISSSVTIEHFEEAVKFYGLSLENTHKNKSIEEVKHIFDNANPFTVFYIDSLQELVHRYSTKIKTKQELDIDIKRCEITNLWFKKDNIVKLSYIKADGSKELCNIFNYISDKVLSKRFYRFEDVFYDLNQSFISPVNFKEVPGSDLIRDINYVPKCIFDKEWMKADCGHFEKRIEITSGYCIECRGKISPTGKIINDYSTRAPKYLKFQDGKEIKGKFTSEKVYYGIELELENGAETEAIKLYKELKDYILCKADGSLNTGFEIITTPATYSVHCDKLKSLITIINDKTEMQAKSTCGLHVHVSRNALSSLQIGKAVEFLYNPDNKKMITNIAGRDNNTYAKIDKEIGITHLAPENFSREHQERHVALNLCNEKTIEFRIFASTTDYDVLMHRLEFVKALIDYTKPCSINVKSIKDIKKWDTFNEFLKQNRMEYPFLTKFLALRKLPPTQQQIQEKIAMKKGLV